MLPVGVDVIGTPTVLRSPTCFGPAQAADVAGEGGERRDR